MLSPRMYGACLIAIVVLTESQVGAAEPLNDTVYWFGDTYGKGVIGGGPTVQMDMKDIVILDDGRIVTFASWDETGPRLKIYKEVQGKPVTDVAKAGKRRGEALAYDGRFLYSTEWRVSGGWDSGKQEHWLVVYDTNLDAVNTVFAFKAPGVHLEHWRFPGGIAVTGGKIYLSVSPSNEQGCEDEHDKPCKDIMVFDAANLKHLPEQDFDLSEEGTAGGDVPRRSCVDGQGFLWIVQQDQAGAYRIRKYSMRGVYQNVEITMPGQFGAADVEYAGIDGVHWLLVADAGEYQQILGWRNIDAKPVRDTACDIGVKGGVHGNVGGEPGEGNDRLGRFFGPTAVARRASDGAIFVTTSGKFTPPPVWRPLGAKIYKFDASRNFQWVLEGMFFQDTADVDHSDDTIVHSMYTRFKIDYDRQTRGGMDHPSWKHIAVTWNPLLYPDDPRASLPGMNQALPMTYQVDGQTFVAMLSNTDAIIYRVDGYLLVPAVWFSKNAFLDAWRPPNLPNDLATGTWLWVDDGDGQFNKGEFHLISSRLQNAWYGLHVDTHGSVWLVEERRPDNTGGTISEYSLPESDRLRNGVPQYTVERRRTWSINDLPGKPGWEMAGRIWYDPDDDVMYLGGFLDHDADKIDRPHRNNRPMWTAQFKEIRRYDSWRTAPRLAWTVDLPFQWAGSGGDDGRRHERWNPRTLDVDVDNDYLFVGYDMKSDHGNERGPGGHMYGDIRVYRTDGLFVGLLMPTPSVLGTTGAIDKINAVNVHKRSDGTYVVFVEENNHGKVIFYQWKPKNAQPARRGR